MSRQNWGYGYASEAAAACLQFGFETLCLSEIYSFTSIHNARSEKVMQRIGMTQRVISTTLPLKMAISSKNMYYTGSKIDGINPGT